MTTTDLREQFATALRNHDHADALLVGIQSSEVGEKALAEYTATIYLWYRTAHPTTRKTRPTTEREAYKLYEKLVGEGAVTADEHTRLVDSLANRIGAHRKALQEERERCRLELERLAPLVQIRPAATFLDTGLLTTPSSFSSQTQPLAYAEGQAKIMAATFALHGVSAKAERVEVPSCLPGDSKRFTMFKVLTAVESRLDVHVMLFRPGLTMREEVRLWWSMALNPRVSHPFLPHGYEEKNGLDFQGREIRKVGGA